MLVLAAGLAAVAVALVTVAALAVGLTGHLRRLTTAVRVARDRLGPQVATLTTSLRRPTPRGEP